MIKLKNNNNVNISATNFDSIHISCINPESFDIQKLICMELKFKNSLDK
jgi:hypothetical protein